MASLTWAMVTDAQGQVTEVLHVPHRASKRKTGGRTMPLHPALQAALVTWQTAREDMATPDRPILCSERGGGLSPATVRLWFHRLSTSPKMDGCASQPDLHDSCGAPRLPGRGQSPGRAGARRPSQPGHAATLHR